MLIASGEEMVVAAFSEVLFAAPLELLVPHTAVVPQTAVLPQTAVFADTKYTFPLLAS